MKLRPTAAFGYTLAAATALFGNAVWAQSEQIEVVRVTAQKRQEDPNKVAMSISAVSGMQLQAQHVNDFTDLTRLVPNISFTAASGNGGAGPGTSNIEVRGISSAAGRGDRRRLPRRSVYHGRQCVHDGLSRTEIFRHRPGRSAARSASDPVRRQLDGRHHQVRAERAGPERTRDQHLRRIFVDQGRQC
ncbi:TonB-dependent receptor plug domain-containing protein [Massilia sp. B-10]|nr:TonB-dependent receptor plug domain-containing protein [Massilia sp. B-10]